MKVVAFNGSPRPKGNTFHGIQVVLAELQKEGIETELVQLGGTNVHGCRADYVCANKRNGRCGLEDDEMNSFIEKMVAADGIIIGSPVYFSNVSSEVKALIDRAGLVAKVNGDMFKRKVGVPVIAVRRSGASVAYAAINYFFGISQMIIPSSNYWNLGVGMNPGDIKNDQEGITTLEILGQNMAWLMKKLA